MRNSQYMIISGQNATDMVLIVNEWIKKGFRPLGGITSCFEYDPYFWQNVHKSGRMHFYQTLIRRESWYQYIKRLIFRHKQ